MKRDKLITYLDDYLRVKEIEDSSQNGLHQVEEKFGLETTFLNIPTGM